ncbi:MAG: hypothetical protein AB7L28_21780 [Kofleriaceae bacterium]
MLATTLSGDACWFGDGDEWHALAATAETQNSQTRKVWLFYIKQG